MPTLDARPARVVKKSVRSPNEHNKRCRVTGKREQNRQPTLAEIAQAMQVLREPEKDNQLITKNALATVGGGIFLALTAWLMNGLNSMQQSVVQVQTTVTALQRSVDQIVQSGAASSDAQGSIRTDVARLQQREDQAEQRLNRLDGQGQNPDGSLKGRR